MTTFTGRSSLNLPATVDPPPQLLNRTAVERAARGEHLEAVVIRRVVRAGDLYPGVATEMVDGEIERRRGHEADVRHLRARGLQAFGKRSG
jgi:hypothetical protein